MHKYIFLPIFILTACASPAAPTTAPPLPSPTAAPVPTATTAPIPITEIKLGPELIQEQDLGLIGGEMSTTVRDTFWFRDVPRGINNFTRKLKNQQGEDVGEVFIMLYDDQDIQQQAIDTINENTIKTQARVSEPSEPLGDWSIIADNRVIIVSYDKAIVAVFSNENSTSALEYYTQALLERLDQTINP